MFFLLKFTWIFYSYIIKICFQDVCKVNNSKTWLRIFLLYEQWPSPCLLSKNSVTKLLLLNKKFKKYKNVLLDCHHMKSLKFKRMKILSLQHSSLQTLKFCTLLHYCFNSRTLFLVSYKICVSTFRPTYSSNLSSKLIILDM